MEAPGLQLLVRGSSKWILNGNNIYNSNAGHVGIGTSTPNSGLELRGTGSMPQMRITDQTFQAIVLFFRAEQVET